MIDEEVIKKTVRETLLQLGVDISTPEETIELQRDFTHMRKQRVAYETFGRHGVLAALGILITGVGVAFWEGFQALLNR